MRVSRAAVLAAVLCGFGAGAADLSHAVAVVVGSNDGQEEEEPLRYAEDDARQFRDVLTELVGLPSSQVLLVVGQGPEAVRAALAEATRRLASWAASGHPGTVLFYFSGHGDDEALHFEAGSLPLDELRALLGATPSVLKLSFVDACRLAGRFRGVTPGPSFHLAPQAEPLRGVVELRASSVGEQAQESDELGGGVFTHFLLSGLRGDADVDQDRRVTLAELYAYAFRRTLLKTGASSALQHPTASMKLEGAGELVLAHLDTASTSIQVPEGGDRHLVFSLPSGAVVGELTPGGATRLTVPPGKYVVARRDGAQAFLASVDLLPGSRATLRVSDFVPVPRRQVAARGAGLEIRRWRLEPKVGVELAPRGPEQVAWQAGAELAYSTLGVDVSFELGFLQGGVVTPGYAGQQQGGRVFAGAGVRRHFGVLTVSVLGGVEGRYVVENVVTSEAERATAAGLPSTRRVDYSTAGPRGVGRVELAVGQRVTVSPALSAALLVRQESNNGHPAWALQPVVTASLGVGYRF